MVGALALRLGRGRAAQRPADQRGIFRLLAFDPGVPYEQELADAMLRPARAISSCATPGILTQSLPSIDAVVDRRRMEYDALMRDVTLPERLWRPARSADGPPVDWSRLRG